MQKSKPSCLSRMDTSYLVHQQLLVQTHKKEQNRRSKSRHIVWWYVHLHKSDQVSLDLPSWHMYLNCYNWFSSFPLECHLHILILLCRFTICMYHNHCNTLSIHNLERFQQEMEVHIQSDLQTYMTEWYTQWRTIIVCQILQPSQEHHRNSVLVYFPVFSHLQERLLKLAPQLFLFLAPWF